MKKYWLSLLIIVSFTACKSDRESHINENAPLLPTEVFSENPLLEKPFTSSINTRDSTMATLYGNAIAWEYANTYNDTNYPPGAILYEVTWKQKPDSLWFGANVPKEIKSVERIMYTTDSKPTYELYMGNPLRKSESDLDTSRISFITAQKIAVSP